jgi:hypothetical protein
MRKNENIVRDGQFGGTNEQLRRGREGRAVGAMAGKGVHLEESIGTTHPKTGLYRVLVRSQGALTTYGTYRFGARRVEYTFWVATILKQERKKAKVPVDSEKKSKRGPREREKQSPGI